MVVATAVASAVATAALDLTPINSVYEVPDLRILLETKQAMTAALVAFLLFGRFRRTSSRNDGFLVYGLSLLALTNFLFALVPALTSDSQASALARFETWAPLSMRAVGAAAFAASALLPHRPSRSRSSVLPTFGAATLTAAVLATAFAAAAEHLPVGVLATATSSTTQLEAHVGVRIAQLLLFVVYAAAAFGFTTRASRERDFLLGSLAVAMVLSAFSRLNFFLYPSLYSDVVHVGDFFRLGSYVVLLVGAGGEIERYWRTQAEAAAARERRRMARELHDGLTQELAFIRSQVGGMTAGTGHPEMLPHVAEAADRAYTEARKLLDVLTQGGVGDLEEQLGTAVRELGSREGVEIVLDGRAPALSTAAQTELVRIACEATTNAMRHGRARRVELRLTADGPALLEVRDNGSGFDPSTVGGRGYGLRSMESRARAIGAELRVRSQPGEGTTVEVSWT
jgi:signal transduction histidine kinase